MTSRREIEAKFIVPDVDEIRRQLIDRGGHVIAHKHTEHNLYFDTPDRKLRSGGQVLRLRTDAAVRLTYKCLEDTFEARTEIELILDDADGASAFLQALGFKIILAYDKLRETFAINGVLVMLDELPFGRFVEIEGASLNSIRQVAASLGFGWEERVQVGYLALFERLRDRLGQPLDGTPFETLNAELLALLETSPTDSEGETSP